MRTVLPLYIVHAILACAASTQHEGSGANEGSSAESLAYDAARSRVEAASAATSRPAPGATSLSPAQSHTPSAAPRAALRQPTSPRDLWGPIRRTTQCPTSRADATAEAVPQLSTEARPDTTTAKHTPHDPNLPLAELEEAFESFEEWKRRHEAEARPPQPPPPPEGTASPADNGSVASQRAVADSTPKVNNSGDSDTNGTGAAASPRGESVDSTGSVFSQAPPRPSTKGGHRYNYASPDCSARVIASSPLTQHASSLLHKSRDRYMLTPCRADEHWVIVELCDEIRVEAVELAVWEFFSGIVRSVRVSVGDDADGNEWNQVGEFVGKNVRGAQTFTLPEPTSFHRFLRLDFPSYYGSEYYCPVSQLRVWGMNQMEAFKMEQRRAAEASGKLEEEVRAKERETERAAEEQRVLEREKKEREEDNRQQKELCELERLVQEQARRISGHPDALLEEFIDCAASPRASSTSAGVPAASGSPAVEGSAGQAPDATAATASSATNNSATATGVSDQASQAGRGALPRVDASESIYAFIIRRLNALEGNSTLVARYIDEQAKALRTAVERAESKWENTRDKDADQRDSDRLRQEARFGRIMNQLEHMRTTMDAERRSTELRLQLLADELGFERRRSLAQLVVLVSIIVLGALSRGEAIDALLRHLSSDLIRRRSNDSRRHVSSTGDGDKDAHLRRQKRLSTGPLAGLLIDVGPYPKSITTPSPADSFSPVPRSPHSPRGTAKTRRPITPTTARRRLQGPRSVSLAEPGSLFDDDMPTPSPNVHAYQASQPRARTMLTPTGVNRAPRRLARSSHLHTMRRRDDASASDAERDETRDERDRLLAPFAFTHPTPSQRSPTSSSRRTPSSARTATSSAMFTPPAASASSTSRPFVPRSISNNSTSGAGDDAWATEDPLSASEVEDETIPSPSDDEFRLETMRLHHNTHHNTVRFRGAVDVAYGDDDKNYAPYSTTT